MATKIKHTNFIFKENNLQSPQIPKNKLCRQGLLACRTKILSTTNAMLEAPSTRPQVVHYRDCRSVAASI